MMISTILEVKPIVYEMNSPVGYAIGAVIAIIILGYLIYALVKPENF